MSNDTARAALMEYIEIPCTALDLEPCGVTSMCKIDLVAVKEGYENRVRELAVKRTRERLEYEHSQGKHPVRIKARDF